uniref:Interleukin-34 n=1 Tax=Strix occidentalis caurina TaxID=311401 RepID=A0A8D0F8H4_STROC
MQQSYAAVLCEYSLGTGLEGGMMAAAPGECELTRLLQDKLQYEMRLQYMKHYFPINYTVQVQYEEVLRPSNITRLRNGTVSEAALRYLWFHVSSQAVLRIREVLPEKHPSWKYTQELCRLFDALGKEYSEYRQTDVEAVVADLVKLVHSMGAESRRKPVRPKALLDNCLKVMRMLYGAPSWEWFPVLFHRGKNEAAPAKMTPAGLPRASLQQAAGLKACQSPAFPVQVPT